MFNITNKIVAEGCYREKNLVNGEEYYYRGAVENLEYLPKDKLFRGFVKGNALYGFVIRFSETEDIKNAVCTCADYQNHPGHFCKHLVAALLAIKDYKHVSPLSRNAEEVTKRLFNSFGVSLEDSLKKQINLEIKYYWGSFYRLGSKPYLELRVGLEKLYIVKNVKKFIDAIANKEEMIFGKKFTYNPLQHTFKENDLKVIDILKNIYDIEKFVDSSFPEKGTSLFAGKKVFMPDPFVEKLFSLDIDLDVNIEGTDYFDSHIVRENVPVEFELMSDAKNLRVNSEEISEIKLLTDSGSFIFFKGLIYEPSKEQLDNLLPIYESFTESYQNYLVIVPDHQERFISEILPHLERLGKVDITPNLNENIVKLPLEASIYLDMEEECLWGDVKFNYGDRTINPFSATNSLDKEKIIVRDVEKEKRILALLEVANFHIKNSRIYLDHEDAIYSFYTEILDNLRKDVEIYYSNNLKNFHPVYNPSFAGKLNLNMATGMLDFSFAVDGIERTELYEIFKAYKERKKYYRLRNGSFLSLDNEDVSEMANVLSALDFKKEDFLEEIKQIPKHQALYFDQLFEEKQLKFLKRNRAFKELTSNIRDPEELDFPYPEDLEKYLRDYQKFGFKWLKTLAHYGFGGILADDMGLGKTLQAIAYILSLKEEEKEPVLVVAPTSLLYNWQVEVLRFAPSLKTLIISGTKPERMELIKEINDVDLVITSYPLIQRDIMDYISYHFSYCILDEAQYIKNHESQRAKSVKMLRAKNYLALTGTPIENSLGELWSIFEFLMPGYLPPFKTFVKKYLIPIEKDGDLDVTRQLSRLVRPFILRRVKEDVLKELPPKIENKMVSELTQDQKKVYLAYLEKISKELNEEIQENGLGKSRMKILAGLTRLRQICCHPSLFLDDYEGESGKVEQLREVLQEIVAGGHRVLIFSQFTSMLAIIKDVLLEGDLSYFYLDGSVKAEERLKRVNEFNKGERDVFLISLKAGGTGLNLTGADVVIHFDPWWNPAVEEQASDRAHRFGQERVVQVLKFIARGTIEEKIYELQQKKKELIEKVVKPGETMLSALTEQELFSLLNN